jgi:hypothetical protein
MAEASNSPLIGVSKRFLFETGLPCGKTQLLLFYGHLVKDLGLKDFWA